MFARNLLPLAAAAAIALLSATQAMAHAVLVKSDPPAGSAVSDLKTISLTFSEELTPAFSGFAVTTGDGKTVPVKTTVSADRKTITGAPTGGHQTAGVYRIAWHAVAADDGHRTQGTVSFTVK